MPNYTAAVVNEIKAFALIENIEEEGCIRWIYLYAPLFSPTQSFHVQELRPYCPIAAEKKSAIDFQAVYILPLHYSVEAIW